jgi:hypothetical protein
MMDKKIYIAIGMILSILYCQNANSQSQEFVGGYGIEYNMSSGWGGECSLMISAYATSNGKPTNGTQTLTCDMHIGDLAGSIKKEFRLKDIETLRTMLQRSRIFEGQFWGYDSRPRDGSLHTITVYDEGRIAVIVENSTFGVGSREQLREFLRSAYSDMTNSLKEDNKGKRND